MSTHVDMPRSTLTVADVARNSGVAPSAVRFYDQHGVIVGERTASNQRRFGPDASCRIKVALLAQRVGLTIREITDLFADLPPRPAPADWRRIGSRLIHDATNRLNEVHQQLSWLHSGTRLCEIVDHEHPSR